MLFGVDRGNVSRRRSWIRLQIGGLIGERDTPLVGPRRVDGEPAHRAEQVGPERVLRTLSGLDYPQYAVVALTDQVINVTWVGYLRGHPARRGLVAGPQLGVRRVVAGANRGKEVGVAVLDVGVSTRVHTLHTNRRFGASDRSRRECPERGETTWSKRRQILTTRPSLVRGPRRIGPMCAATVAAGGPQPLADPARSREWPPEPITTSGRGDVQQLCVRTVPSATQLCRAGSES